MLRKWVRRQGNSRVEKMPELTIEKQTKTLATYQGSFKNSMYPSFVLLGYLLQG